MGPKKQKAYLKIKTNELDILEKTIKNSADMIK